MNWATMLLITLLVTASPIVYILFKEYRPKTAIAVFLVYSLAGIVLACALPPDPDCDAARIETGKAITRRFFPQHADILDRLDVRCAADVRGISQCQRDVDGCTLWTGGGPYRARVFVKTGVDEAALLCHEAGHWAGVDNHGPQFPQATVDDCARSLPNN